MGQAAEKERRENAQVQTVLQDINANAGIIRTLSDVLEGDKSALVQSQCTGDSSMVSLSSLQVGNKAIFLPFTNGVYIPFVTRQYSGVDKENEKGQMTESLTVMSHAGMSSSQLVPSREVQNDVRNNFFLDIDILSPQIQELIT
eukprot:TRINITY_DN3437_c0_g1_i3.p1 TRINITY_DN3437_c0_g1~~TRINITY_DN3437_c0_g1_i3.p1  ORF type:complete len:157 (+),score=38.54 TRINITY_DN3437_c0_g1_i3:41-472(+)